MKNTLKDHLNTLTKDKYVIVVSEDDKVVIRGTRDNLLNHMLISGLSRQLVKVKSSSKEKEKVVVK